MILGFFPYNKKTRLPAGLLYDFLVTTTASATGGEVKIKVVD